MVTHAGLLPARWLIHTVGPIWQGGEHQEDQLLRSAYQASLKAAVAIGARHVAFPSISTGAYKYPLAQAAHIAMMAIKDFLDGDKGVLGRITLVLFNAEHYHMYQKCLYDIFPDNGVHP